MIKIGITGSIASGKSTVARILSKNNRRLFSADHVVKKLYSSPDFQKKLIKKFKLNKKKVKEEIKKRLLKKELNLKDLGKFIQPFVRKKMKAFAKNKNKNEILFYEVPLLIESKLMNFFDLIIIVVSARAIRLKRYIRNGGNKRLFNILEKHQISQIKKVKYCDFIIVNNKTKEILKKRVDDIIL
tara:strand:+ start:3343 stop:3897 length:555 start_codon:yes stop_codon:yes gene_type:complete